MPHSALSGCGPSLQRRSSSQTRQGQCVQAVSYPFAGSGSLVTGAHPLPCPSSPRRHPTGCTLDLEASGDRRPGAPPQGGTRTTARRRPATALSNRPHHDFVLPALFLPERSAGGAHRMSAPTPATKSASSRSMDWRWGARLGISTSTTLALSAPDTEYPPDAGRGLPRNLGDGNGPGDADRSPISSSVI